MTDPRGTVARAIAWATFAYVRHGWEEVRWPGMNKPRGNRRP